MYSYGIGILSVFVVSIHLVNTIQPSCESEIYCRGDLLRTVQLSKIYPDSKTFVDKKLKYPVQQVLENFNQTFVNYTDIESSPPADVVEQFVVDNFEDGQELKPWLPPDWSKYPPVLRTIVDSNLKKYAYELNGIWKNLSRKVIDDVKENQDMYSLIYVPNGFVIPGGRFKELYYWDTYWIVNGLLICDMVHTAKGVIENLIHLVKKIGHVPNGSRVYYTERTQPPMLTLMVEQYYLHTGDFNFIMKNIEFLDKEIDYWLDTRLIEVEKDGEVYSMFRYFAPSEGPRPESYREDIETVSHLDHEDDVFMKFISLKSAAESGWDFSSRWFIDQNCTNKGKLTDIMTQNIIPVDLNALLHKNFVILLRWHTELGNSQKIMKYYRLSTNLMKGIGKVLWNDDEKFWTDYDIENEQPRNYFYLSNFVPLWTKSHKFRPMELTKIVMNYITKYNLQNFPGGIPTSLEYSGEQWDFPNAWPPLQAFFIQGLDRIGTVSASELAYRFASRYVLSNYKGFVDFGVMFEKYDAMISGRTGGGGEYDGQEGFGWSNGIIFELLRRWGSRLRSYKPLGANSNNASQSLETTDESWLKR